MIQFSQFKTHRKSILIFTGVLVSLAAFQNCSLVNGLNSGFETIGQSTSLSSLSASVSQSLSKSPVRRMSNLEYTNSIRDAIDFQFKKQNATSTLGSTCINDQNVAGAISTMPTDVASLRLASNQIANSLSPTRFESYVQVAGAIGTFISRDLTTLKAFVGNCATSNTNLSDQTCVNDFINSFGQFTFRKPILAIELNEIKSGATSWSDLVGRLLVHPRFLSHVDREGMPFLSNTYKLTPYELEARLTSVFWKSIPDAIGLQVAASGQLATAAGLKTEVERILDSSKAQDAMWVFYQQWFGASRLQKYFNSNMGHPFVAFSTGFVDSELAVIPAAVMDETKDYFNYFTWQTPGTLEQVFRSPLIFTQNAALAKIYGVSPRASASAPPISDSTGHFLGILSRPFVTQQKVSGNGDANHIQRGVLFATNFLKLNLGLPANFAEQTQAANAVPANASSRDEATIKTNVSNCMSCHSIINPSGFVFGHYDSLGRYGTVETRYKENAAGTGAIVQATNPIDSSTTLQISGQQYTVSDIPSLVDAMISSGKLYEAFASYYFRFAFGRLEDPSADREILNVIISQAKTGSIKSALVQLGTSSYLGYEKSQ